MITNKAQPAVGGAKTQYAPNQ